MALPKRHPSEARRFLAPAGAVRAAAMALWLGMAGGALGVRAQTADDFFHGGAQSYIHGEKEKAKQQVVSGLNQFPEDPKLKAMAVLLQKPEEKPQQQQQQEQQQNQQNQDQSSQSQPQDSKQQQQEQKDKKEQQQAQQNQDQKSQEKQKEQEQQKQEQQAAAQNSGKPSEESEKQPQQGETVPGQMTPEQAQQLLDAQKGQEKMLPAKPEVKQPARNRPLRDW